METIMQRRNVAHHLGTTGQQPQICQAIADRAIRWKYRSRILMQLLKAGSQVAASAAVELSVQQVHPPCNRPQQSEHGVPKRGLADAARIQLRGDAAGDQIVSLRGRQVFGEVARSDTDIVVQIRRSLEAVGRTAATNVTAFADGRPGLRSILADAGVTTRPIAEWFHIAMRLQHAKLAAGGLLTNEPGRTQAKVTVV
ncbi:MAG TPA: hypothetical protein VFE41_32390, partial [Acetobacteraceae bacterium]|nr:hypothetical protein [Acetobacteraceae bacterium]